MMHRNEKTYTMAYHAVEKYIHDSSEEALMDVSRVHREVPSLLKGTEKEKMTAKDFSDALEGMLHDPAVYHFKNVKRENMGRVMFIIFSALLSNSHTHAQPLWTRKMLVSFINELREEMLHPSLRDFLLDFVHRLVNHSDTAVPLVVPFNAIKTILLHEDPSYIAQGVDMLQKLQSSMGYDINKPVESSVCPPIPPLAICVGHFRVSSELCRQLVVRLGANVNATYAIERTHLYGFNYLEKMSSICSVAMEAVAASPMRRLHDFKVSKERLSVMNTLLDFGMQVTELERPKIQEFMKISVEIIRLVRTHPAWAIDAPEDTVGEYVLDESFILRKRTRQERAAVRMHVALGMPDEGVDNLVEEMPGSVSVLDRDYLHAQYFRTQVHTGIEMAFLVKDFEWLRELVFKVGEKAALMKLFLNNETAIQIAARIFPAAVPLHERENLTQEALEFVEYLRSGKYDLTRKTFGTRPADVRERVRQSLLVQQRMANAADEQALIRLPSEMWDLMRSYM